MAAKATPSTRVGLAGSTSKLDALVIPVGVDWYALDVRAVREVVTNPHVTDVPTAGASVLGVFNLRGDIVPLFDTGALLSLGPLPPCFFAAVVETAMGLAGLAASGVPEAVSLGEPTGPSDAEGTAGSYVVGTRVVTLLDLDALLAPVSAGGNPS